MSRSQILHLLNVYKSIFIKPKTASERNFISETTITHIKLRQRGEPLTHSWLSKAGVIPLHHEETFRTLTGHLWHLALLRREPEDRSKRTINSVMPHSENVVSRDFRNNHGATLYQLRMDRSQTLLRVGWFKNTTRVFR